MTVPPAHCAIVAVLDDVRLGDVRSSRALLDGGLPAAVEWIKVIACDAETYGTSRLLRRPLPSSDARTFGDALSAVAPSVDALRRMRAVAPERKLVVAPYDVGALRVVERAEIDALQIDPACSTNTALVRDIASIGHPVFLCTWGCTRDDLRRALDACGNATVVLVHALRRSPYEALLEDVAALRWLASLGFALGCSADAATPFPAGLALAMGATQLQVPLESGAPNGWDAFVSMVRRIERMHAGLEDRMYPPDELDELEDLRVGLVAAQFIPKGTTLTERLIAARAPAVGVTADLLPAIVNRVTAYDIDVGEPITFGMLQ